jgi:N-acetylglucosaminyl-diphospho-decaprenol L-rhamnosyltransferase
MENMPDLRLSFIIVTRNRVSSLMRLLDSIEGQTYACRETIVVDDASEDGTADAVKARYPHIRCLTQPERRGVGPGLELGSAQAAGEVWIELDDDAWLASSDSAASVASRFADSPGLDVLCFKVEAPDGSVRRREIPRRDKRLPEVDTPIGYFLGGAVAFRATSLRAAGGYPVDIAFASWENDVAFRMFKAGFHTVFAPSIVVVHEAVPSPYNTLEREANYVRNEIRLAARYLPAPYAQVHAALWIALSLAQAVVRGHLSATFAAVREGLRSWGMLRADARDRLTSGETRRLSALSGRTWY